MSLLYSFKSRKTTSKFLTDGHENINKISCFFLVKSALECYKSLKEGLGTHTPSHESVCLIVECQEWLGRDR